MLANDVFEEVYNEMLDEVFGESNQRLSRSEFCSKMTGAGKKYLHAKEIRKIVDNKLNSKNLTSYLKAQANELGQLKNELLAADIPTQA